MTSEQPSILVADCDATRHGPLQSLCLRRGWDCQFATNPEELQRLVDQGKFDLVIAEATMPGLDYKALLGQACRRRPSQLLVVVGDMQDGDAEIRLLRGNETDILARPADLAWVERCMEQATLAKRQEKREQLAYSFVVSERTEMRFSCKQLSEAQAISLPVIERLVACHRMSEVDGLKVRLAVQEALLNAFEHGNLELESRWKDEKLGDSHKFAVMRQERLADSQFANRKVSVTSWFDGDAVEIVVKDQGRGFDPTEAAIQKKDNLSCFGRGLTLMKSAMDEVYYSCGGTEVTLVKRLNTNRST
jgi:anti-sigma regulatory factor (Ser/Thr protein kinase)